MSATNNTSSDLSIKANVTDLLPIGSYIQFAGTQAPEGFLVCNGAAISRSTYSKLFSVIGTTYGSGDGSTTFNLPNLVDKFLQCSSEAGHVFHAGLPNITGTTSTVRFPALIGGGTGAFNTVNGAYAVSLAQGDAQTGLCITLNASSSNSIYGKSSTVQPPAITAMTCIKY